MDVRLSAEQQALRDSAAQVLDRLGPKSVRDFEDSERSAKLDATVEASGWRGLRAADEGEAPLASAVEAAIVAEEMAGALGDASFLGPTLAADLRRLARVAPAPSIETVLLAADLSSLASAVTGAVAIDAGGCRSAVLLDNASALGQVQLDDQRIGPDLTRPCSLPVAERGVALGGTLTDTDLLRWNALALALTCADLVGVMRGAVRLACDYAGARRQFGAHVGSFQAVQHLLADAHVAVEGSRSVALHAAWAVDSLAPDDALSAGAAAKAYCARSARTVCEAAIQVHGGIGNTWDCLAHVYLRRALLSTEVLGGVGPNLQRVLEHRGLGGLYGLR